MRGTDHNLRIREWAAQVFLPIGAAMHEAGDQVWYDVAQLSAMEAAASGTTCLIENSINFGKYHAIAMATALRDFGIRGAVARGAEDSSQLSEGQVNPTDHEIKTMQEFLETWQKEEDDLVAAWVGPTGIDGKSWGGCSAALLGELKKLSNSYGTRYHIHLAGTRTEVENASRMYGLPGSVAIANDVNILDENTSIVHCIWISKEEERIIGDTGAQICHCPSSNELSGAGVIPLISLMKRGINCAIGTDGTPQNGSLDMFREMRQAVLLHRVENQNPSIINHLDAFRMATVNGTKVLGTDKLGIIEPGYLADLVTIRSENNIFLMPIDDPLETLIFACSGGRDVAMTIIDGKVIYKDGEFKTIDAEKIISNVKEKCRWILEKSA
jgi:5-methylthioadenosine/S-adenosylhomocysteine deaminase